ncbi:PKD domain containing protein [Hymenobacter roseosalivarius DSM 11622]|uniref:PKD domain containing protein n=2 Tax=Hymenobacter roseosalivarius TaxID=89967 RepID=A0A1W1V7K6_9BACT|nr:PKD domain containing protein [Hymenobacter roseosalivarius DSM 11622]
MLLFLLLSGAATTARAQATPPPECSDDEKFINQWYFGQRAGLNFNEATDSIPPAVLTDGRMVAPAGSGVMSDRNGSLLFYSNGDTVWSRDHNIMLNGTGMGGNRLGTDGPLAIKRPGIVPPGAPTRYFIFTQDAQGGPKGLSYSEIVIPDGGQGEVVAATKNTPLTLGTAEKMTGVLHKNGCDIWIIVHGWGNATSGTNNRGDSFLAYRVTPAGVQLTPIISTVGALHAPSVAAQGYRGQMKVTPDGEQLAVARFSETLADASSTVELFAFDAATGVVSNPQVIDSGAGRYYGVEFSPSRNRLYATVQSPPQLLQFDLNATDVPASKQVIPLNQNPPANLGSLQAGPDDKIYVAREKQPALGFITYPDSLGAKVAYADDSLALGGRRSGLGLPNFNQSSLLRIGIGARSTACLQITFQASFPVQAPDLVYAWTFGDGTTSSVADPVHTYPAPGDYVVTLRITNDCFCRETRGIIRVPGPPTPGSIGANQAICAGAPPAPLTSTAPAGAGTGEFSYQWQSSPDNATWTDIGGANAPGFTLGPLNVTTYFRRLVTSGFCAPRTPTASVVITVLPALTAGSIAANQTVCAGSTPAPLTSTAPATGGTGTFAYQWESSLDNTTWGAISGATGETFTPGPLTATTFFRRQVRSGTCATPPSNVVTLTVVPALVAGTIATNQALCAGGTPTPLTSETPAAGGTGTIVYQWESSADNATWTPVGGANGSTYAPGPLAATTYFRRQASAGGACAPAFSNVLIIRVLPALTAGTIGTDQTLCPGATPASLTSTAGASGGTGTFAYQWESSPNNANWTPIVGATGADYTPGPLTTNTFFRRQVTSGPCGLVFTPSVALTVLPALSAGSIAADQTICAGAAPTPLTSTSEAGGGTGTFAYQWESSADNVTWGAIPGATNPTFAPSPMTATTFFRRRVTSGTGTCSTGTSNVVTVRVQPLVMPSVSLAAPPTQCPGTALTFTAVATNAGPAPIFQWFVNNVAVASGPTFTSSTLVTGDQVRVEVTPTAGLCSTAPATATVTVTRTPTPLPTLAIAVQPGGPVCLGAPLTFSIASVTEAGPTPEYQWQVNGSDVAGATGPVFTSTTLREGQTVTLRLRTTNVCGQQVAAVSNGVAVRIQPPVDVDAGPDKEILAGTSVTLEGRADGTYPVTWTPTVGLTFRANDPLRPVASPTVTTTYTLSAGEGGCADSDQVTVTVRPPIRIPNAFTPNGDGRDDTWQIEFIEQFPDNTVSVFNRWGNRIFSAENYSRANEWRGDINGQPAPVGTYYYVVTTRGPLGKSYSGSITILY